MKTYCWKCPECGDFIEVHEYFEAVECAGANTHPLTRMIRDYRAEAVNVGPVR